jgi:hypothetical protein
MPAATNEYLEAPSPKPVEEAALRKKFLWLRVTVNCKLCLAPDLQDIHEHQKIHDSDRPEERTRHRGADCSAWRLHLGQAPPDRCGSDNNRDRKREHDRRMTKEKKKPMPKGRLSFCSMYRTVSSTAAMWFAFKCVAQSAFLGRMASLRCRSLVNEETLQLGTRC